MVGTVTFTEKANITTVKCIKMVWVSDASGNVTLQSTANKYDGEVLLLTTVPAGGGSAPTDNYDITLLDENGADVLCGAGQNRDTANTETVAKSSLGAVAGSALTPNISNAGNAKGGTIYVYIR